jgi:KUP system potassium uptake protein
MSQTAEHSAKRAFSASAAIAALGIIYRDIGTSPLYALKQAAQATGQLTSVAIIGLLSFMFWALFLVVSAKYAILTLRADNQGEGGIMALLALR